LATINIGCILNSNLLTVGTILYNYALNVARIQLQALIPFKRSEAVLLSLLPKSVRTLLCAFVRIQKCLKEWNILKWRV